MDKPEHPLLVHLAVTGWGSELAKCLPEEVGKPLESLSLSQQLLSGHIKRWRQKHGGLDVFPVTLHRRKAISSVQAGPTNLQGLIRLWTGFQLHTDWSQWTYSDCEQFSFCAAFLLRAAASPGTLLGSEGGISAWIVSRVCQVPFPLSLFSTCYGEAKQFLMSL